VRVNGTTWREWVFVGRRADLIKPGPGKGVVKDLFDSNRPEVWVSNMLGAQRGHGGKWQVCLAHLLRDAQYAIEDGDTAFSAPFRRRLRAMAIGKWRNSVKEATLKQYLYDLDRRLDQIMAAEPAGDAGRRLHKRMRLHRQSLFVFITRRDMPSTNNVSERHLRPSAILRKVINGFRCEWGAEGYAAAFRSVVSTAKASGASVLGTVRFVLSAPRASEAVPGGGVSNYQKINHHDKHAPYAHVVPGPQWTLWQSDGPPTALLLSVHPSLHNTHKYLTRFAIAPDQS